MPTVNELYKGRTSNSSATARTTRRSPSSRSCSSRTTSTSWRTWPSPSCIGKVEKHDLAVTHAEKAVEVEPQDTFNWTALSTTYQRAFEATRDRQYIFRAEDAKARAAQMQWQRVRKWPICAIGMPESRQGSR